jgi:hypothetical protein
MWFRTGRVTPATFRKSFPLRSGHGAEGGATSRRTRDQPCSGSGSAHASSRDCHFGARTAGPATTDVPTHLDTVRMPCKALTNHTSQPSRSGTRRRRCLIRVPDCLAIFRMSCAVTPGRILSAGDGMHRHGPSHHNRLEFVASNTRPDRVVSSASSAPAVDARRRTSARRARSGPFLRGAVLGSDSSQAHSRTAALCGGAGRILKRSSARGRAHSSTRGNQRPCRGSSRTVACQNACNCSWGMWATSMHPRKKRRLCRSSPRTRPSETSQESAMSGGSSSCAQGARLRPAPQANSRPAFLNRRTVEDTVEQPLREHRADAALVTLLRVRAYTRKGPSPSETREGAPGLAIDLREGPQFKPRRQRPSCVGADADRQERRRRRITHGS